jgi:hypothetical protein
MNYVLPYVAWVMSFSTNEERVTDFGANVYLLLLLLLLLLAAIDFSLGGSSTYTSTDSCHSVAVVLTLVQTVVTRWQ